MLGKYHQKAVTGVLYDPAAMIEDDRVYCASMGLEGGMRSRLIGAHHAGVTGDVRADYGGQASVHLPSVSCTRGPLAYYGTW